MNDAILRFNDGGSYERMMGRWSRLAGREFLDWVAPPGGLKWLDVGCGNGAFTELLMETCAPASVHGVDPSSEQLTYARQRNGLNKVEFVSGDAMSLPFATGSFDAAVMALVIFFVPEPARGVAEMARVVKPGGLVCAYAWDSTRGGFPLEAVHDEMKALGVEPNHPPSPQAARIENLRALWREAGIRDVETREFSIRRTFASFEDFWDTSTNSTLKPKIGAMDAAAVEQLKQRLKLRLPSDANGRISYHARANGVKGFTS